MDPTQTLTDLLLAIDSEDRDAARWACEYLAEWLAKDGFYPQLRAAIARANLSGVEVVSGS